MHIFIKFYKKWGGGAYVYILANIFFFFFLMKRHLYERFLGKWLTQRLHTWEWGPCLRGQSCSQSIYSIFEIQPIRRGNTTKRRLVKKQSGEDFRFQTRHKSAMLKLMANYEERRVCVFRQGCVSIFGLRALSP